MAKKPKMVDKGVDFNLKYSIQEPAEKQLIAKLKESTANGQGVVSVFAPSGDRTSISTDSSSTQLSFNYGWGTLYSTDWQAGGEFVRRDDMNGILNYYSNAINQQSLGNQFTFDANNADGYAKGAVLWSEANNCFVISNKEDNTDNFVLDNSFIGVSWIKINAGNADNATHANYADSAGSVEYAKYSLTQLGYGQQWVNVSADRSLGLSVPEYYLNSTGRTLAVAIIINGLNGATASGYAFVNSSNEILSQTAVTLLGWTISGETSVSGFFLVPNGYFYGVNSTIIKSFVWNELKDNVAQLSYQHIYDAQNHCIVSLDNTPEQIKILEDKLSSGNYMLLDRLPTELEKWDGEKWVISEDRVQQQLLQQAKSLLDNNYMEYPIDIYEDLSDEVKAKIKEYRKELRAIITGDVVVDELPILNLGDVK